MDIAIMTCKDKLDYNNVLQTYGMYNYLKKKGNQVQVIDYVSEFDNKKDQIFFNNSSKKCRILEQFIQKEMVTTFMRYRNVEDLYDEPPLADSYIVTNASSKDLSLNFKGISGSKKSLAYAIEEESESDLKLFESSYDTITCVFPVDNEEVKRVIDPLFLLSKDEWYDLAIDSKAELGNKNYILIYSDVVTKEMIEYAKELSKYRDAKIYAICNKIENRLGVNKVYNTAVPSEFVALFQNADDIVTSQDDGIKLACIFERELHIFIDEEKNDNSIIEMINEYSLVNRIVNSVTSVLTRSTDYLKANERINELKEASFDVLEDIIKE